ncbi:MAG: substrate-binding domain-containing protein [Bacteroidales bacterium]
MHKTGIYLLAFLFLLFSSRNDKKNKAPAQNEVKNDTQQEINIFGTHTLYPLLMKWKKEYEQSYPNTKIIIKTNEDEKYCMASQNNKFQLISVSRELTEKEKEAGFFSVPVAIDVILPVISFNNNNIQQIVMNGLTKTKLAAAFSGKITKWGQLLNISSNDKIEVFRLRDSSEISISWANFLSLKPSDFSGSLLYNSKDVPVTIASNANALGYCSSTDIYDATTGFKKKNLYVIPIDFNNNNLADDNELVLDKKDDLNRAVSSGQYPFPPSRKIFLAYNTKTENKAVKEFLTWALSIGQNYCIQSGFVHIDKKTAEIFLKKL